MSDNHQISISKCPLGEINHLDLLSEHICSLYLNEDYSDVVLIVDGKKFFAHKFILASRSEYFRALLFGGLKESLPDCNEIELKEASAQAFVTLLKYIYTGKMSLTSQKEEILLETLGLANQYGFTQLEGAISEYLKAILTVKNVCSIYDMANLYRLSSLLEACFQFMDHHSSEIIEGKIYLTLSAAAMHDMIRRDSFCVNEIEIFKAVHSWAVCNPDVDPTEILRSIRLSLMNLGDIMDVVRPTNLVPPDALLDAIREKIEKRNSDLSYRGFLAPEENIATQRHGAHVTLGENPTALLDGETSNYDLDRGFARHPIDENNSSGIVIKLGMQSIINHIKLLLWDKDMRAYSYYIETSVDEKDWVKIIDHSHYLCRSWQNLFFNPRVVRYIKIVGTHNTVNRVFHLVHCEALYTCHLFKLVDGILCPTNNVASLSASACVIEGVSRCRNALLNGDTKNYDWDSGYTCHQLGSGCIIIQLAQPYIIGSMRLLLWDCDERSYKYYIEVSTDQVNWTRVVNRCDEFCKSWQSLSFKPRPVIFIKIVGTHNTANEVFHCVHFECPSSVVPNYCPSPIDAKITPSLISSSPLTAQSITLTDTRLDDRLSHSPINNHCIMPMGSGDGRTSTTNSLTNSDLIYTTGNQISYMNTPNPTRNMSQQTGNIDDANSTYNRLTQTSMSISNFLSGYDDLIARHTLSTAATVSDDLIAPTNQRPISSQHGIQGAPNMNQDQELIYNPTLFNITTPNTFKFFTNNYNSSLNSNTTPCSSHLDPLQAGTSHQTQIPFLNCTNSDSAIANTHSTS